MADNAGDAVGAADAVDAGNAVSATAVGAAANAQDRDPRAHRARDIAAVVLAFVSGSTDAIGFLALGGTFTSVMTGNLVLLGTAAARHDGELAGHATAAIAAFVVGAAVGTRVAGTPRKEDAVWPVAVTRALAVELVLLAIYAVFWWVNGSAPTGSVQAALLAVNAFALGLQSSTIQRFGVAGLSTTYMTGTLTTLVIRIASGRPLRDVSHSGSLLVALVVGAAAGAAVVLHQPTLTPLLQLVGVATALVLGLSVQAGRSAHRQPVTPGDQTPRS
jgi:uncharacterized membrane protein YoaK (UPF0700 family)